MWYHLAVVTDMIFNQLHWSQMIGVYDDKMIYPPEHPWQKPISLIERLVRIYTNPGDTVLDPFFGSGQTGIACKDLGRHYIGIEQDETYYKLAQKNLGGSNGSSIMARP